MPEVPAEVVARVSAEVAALDRDGARAADRGARSGDCGAAQGARSAAGDAGAGGARGDGAVARELSGCAGRRGCSTGSRSSGWCSIPGARCCASGSRARFETMLELGAVEEVEALRAHGARSVAAGDEGDRGARDFGDWLDGVIDARGGDRAGGDRDAAVRQAAADVDPQPDGGLAAGYVTSMTWPPVVRCRSLAVISKTERGLPAAAQTVSYLKRSWSM